MSRYHASQALMDDATIWIREALAPNTPSEELVYDLEYRRNIDNEMTDSAVEYIAEMAASDNPFFLFMGMTRPHFPNLPSAELTTGTSPTTFGPDEAVTREQMAAFLARLYRVVDGGDAPVVSTPFTDVASSSFARDDIGRLYGLGITNGTSPTKLGPHLAVTREQMAAFLARLYRITAPEPIA